MPSFARVSAMSLATSNRKGALIVHALIEGHPESAPGDRRRVRGLSGHFAANYRRLLRGDTRIQNPTRRKIAEQLGVPAFGIAELIPAPSQTYLDSIDAAIAGANRQGWIVGDAETGLPTDAREQVRYTPEMQEPSREQAA